MECLNCKKETNNPKFCSRSCSATRNNSLHPKRVKLDKNKITQCVICDNKTYKSSNVCSSFCRGIKKILDGKAGIRVLKNTRLATEGNTCSICKGTEWQGKPMPLILDHIDGNSYSNSWENVRLVCGNCDMLLETHKGKNRGSGRAYRRKRYAEGKSY